MIYRYDRKTDILVLILGKGKLDFAEQEGEIITHYNKSGRPLEIEILDARKNARNIVNAIVKTKKQLAVASN